MELLHPGVFIREVSSGVQTIEGVSTSTTGFIGEAPRGAVRAPRLVTSFTQFQAEFGWFTFKGYLYQAAYCFFNNGGRRLYVLRVTKDETTATLTLKAAGAGGGETGGGDTGSNDTGGDDTSGDDANTGGGQPAIQSLSNVVAGRELLTLSATSPGAWGKELSVAIRPGTIDPENEFKLIVARVIQSQPIGPADKDETPAPQDVIESFDNLSWKSGEDNFVDRVINASSLYVTAVAKVDQSKPEELPKKADLPKGIHPLTGGDEKVVTDVDFKDRFASFDHVPDINILASPGLATAVVVNAGMEYCEGRQDCFFIADAPQGSTVASVKEHLDKADATLARSSYGALYFPWVKASDPTRQCQQLVSLPPSGFLTGIYARTDGKRGVFKAPAGTEATLAGALGLEAGVSDAQQDTLNPIGVNAIRSFPASGIVVWGTRTLATRSKPEYRYVPVRRLTIFIEQSIYNGIQWAVFEPNDEPLWSSLRLSIGAFMMNQFRSGAFQGATASQAFFVKCDADTNPQSQIDAGIVMVLVGFAPVKPAEFVVLQISQKTAGAAV